MFVISQLQDTIAVQPRDHYGLDEAGRRATGRALETEINKKYVNKVYPELGLCICLWSILDTSEGVVTYGDGCLYYKVSFQMVIFKPTPDEILTGRVLNTDPEEIRVSLGFFRDIYVPKKHFVDPTKVDPETGQLYWAMGAQEGADDDSDDAEESEGVHKFYITVGEAIRVRVAAAHFDYGSAPGAKAAMQTSSYRLECSIADAGLGLLDWW